MQLTDITIFKRSKLIMLLAHKKDTRVSFMLPDQPCPRLTLADVQSATHNIDQKLPDQTCQRFTLADIQSATHNFNETLVIGHGGFGKVYKCSNKILSFADVALKRLNSMSSQGANEFEAEVKVLSKLRHANIVSLIGYCREGKEMVLAYEFMPNGTLQDDLRKSDSSLSWLQRLKVCIGAALGLDYLHTSGVIHRDMKTSNILLDTSFAAKISDFGLAKVTPLNQTQTYVSTVVKGTFGYMDPCYFNSGKLTKRSDVYAFGVVLFEVLTGKRAVDSTLDEEQWSLAVWAQDQIKQGKLNQIVDYSLKGHISKKCLKEFANVAIHCLDNQPKQRPTMAEVVVKLRYIMSHERERAYSGVDEGRFINKVRSFFTGRADSILDPAPGSNTEITRSIRPFTYAELLSSTYNFSHREFSPSLHETIYKGWVDEVTYAPTEPGFGLAMYVRKRNATKTSELHLKPKQFNHFNLVKLLGYCLNGEELYCVYELILNTSLDQLLFGDPGSSSLSWPARLKIALGTAHGLSFLHQRKHPAYNQFKSTCILVDMDYNARLSDFEVVDPVAAIGSYSFQMDAPYVAPDWFRFKADAFDGLFPPSKGHGVESEIYSFGVVLLEMLTGMKAYDENRPHGKQHLVKWATPLLADEANLGIIIDPQLQDNKYLLPKGAFNLALLVSKCLQPYQEVRPSMEEIIKVLCQCY